MYGQRGEFFVIFIFKKKVIADLQLIVRIFTGFGPF
jgi:hypothetical protein